MVTVSKFLPNLIYQCSLLFIFCNLNSSFARHSSNTGADDQHEKTNKIKSLYANTDISIFSNLRYLRLKLLKNKENNKKICDIFHHNFKNIPCYVTSEVSLKRFYFALFDDGLTLKTLKLAYIGFCIQTLQNIHPCADDIYQDVTAIVILCSRQSPYAL